MNRPALILTAILAVLIASAGVVAMRLGDEPMFVARWLPLDLAAPDEVFQDWRIAALMNDRDLCRRALDSPLVEVREVDDQPLANRCGWSNALRMTRSGGALLFAEPLSCPMAASLTLWMTQKVQPAAMRLLGHKIAAVRTFGTYSCRGISGNAYADRLKALHLPVPRSQHATANAIDIAQFILDNGDSVSVLLDWHGSGPKADFLHAAHDGACDIFRGVLGPDANAAHANHFHLDRGPWAACH